MDITISELRAAAAILFDHLEHTGRTRVTIPHDYYWDIPSELIYDPAAEPGEFTLGQLSDDINEMRKIVDGEKDPLGYALVWLGALLRAVGEQTVH